MLPSVWSFGVALVTFVALDALWLGFIMRRRYRTWLSPIARISGGSMAPIWPAAAGVYLLLALGVVAFALPRAGGLVLPAAGWGGLLGVVTYGLYNLTNYATLAAWPLAMTVVDIAWGAALCASASAMATLAEGWMR